MGGGVLWVTFSEYPLVGKEIGVSLPTQLLMERLRGGVGQLGGEDEAEGAHVVGILGGSRQKRGTDAESASGREDDEIVQGKDAGEGLEGEAGIELGEADGGLIGEGYKDDGLVVFETVQEELGVSIEEGDEEFEVGDGGLSDHGGQIKDPF